MEVIIITERVVFTTTINKDLIEQLKIDAMKNKVNVNDILEMLITKYLNGEISSKGVIKMKRVTLLTPEEVIAKQKRNQTLKFKDPRLVNKKPEK